MAGLRRFEIDAVISELRSKVDTKNKEIVVSDDEVMAVVEDKYKEAIELEEVNNTITELQLKRTELQNTIADKRRSEGILGYSSPNLNGIKSIVEQKLREDRGFINFNTLGIPNKVIIASSSGNLQEVVDGIAEELNL